MAVESCATEKQVVETVEAPTAEDTTATPNCGIEHPSDANSAGIKKRPSPIANSDSKYESPMKKVTVEIDAEESLEAIEGDESEGTISPVEESAEEQPTDKAVTKGEKTEEKPAANEQPSKASQEEVTENTLPEEVDTADEKSPQVQAAEGD